MDVTPSRDNFLAKVILLLPSLTMSNIWDLGDDPRDKPEDKELFGSSSLLHKTPTFVCMSINKTFSEEHKWPYKPSSLYPNKNFDGKGKMVK
jgi:hypothetical protein